MKFFGTYQRTITNEKGDFEISFTVTGEDKFLARKAVEKVKDLPKLTIDVAEYRKARSLDANAYMWTLLEKLALALKTNSVELYRKYIREVGVWKDYKMSKDVAKAFTHLWQEKGLAWLIDKVDEKSTDKDEIVTLRAYYGSSSYNTKQMSRLIDSIVQDCKEMGIETMTDAEIQSLVRAHK